MVRMKGFKVTDWKRSRICGVACNTLSQLKDKGCKKLQIHSKQVAVCLQDGTFVDSEDYFNTLQPQTLFLLVLPNQDVLTGYELLYNMLSAVHKNYLNVGKIASDFLSQDLKSKIRDISAILERQSSLERAKLSSRDDDPVWFEGLDTNSNSKEEYMFKRSQERIRGYLYKSLEDIKRSPIYINDPKARSKLDDTFSVFKGWLRKVHHFGCYFHRNFKSNSQFMRSLCDAEGYFHCQGKWNENNCSHADNLITNSAKHTINPYESKEARVVFSTWNLDHRIERARQVCPALLEAVKLSLHEKRCLNAMYFFSLLFTSSNLKLVHIVCHDKGEHHGAKCDKKNFLTKEMLHIDNLILNESKC